MWQCIPLELYCSSNCFAVQLAFIMSISRKCSVAVVGSGPVGMLMSNILSSYSVDHVLIDRREKPVEHPQAHFLTARTMEILQTHCPSSHTDILSMLQQSINWREFSYCHTLSGTQLGRVDHFKNTPSWFWNESPTSVAHLAQSKVESALRKEVVGRIKSSNSLLLGYNVTDCKFSEQGSTIVAKGCAASTADKALNIHCEYLIGADGASSFVRNALGVRMIGDEAMQFLVNVHFSCPGLRGRLKPAPAMLYFTFNEALVAVFVAHDAASDEWVCQIPYFPPFQTPQDYTVQEVTRLLTAAIFPDPSQALPIHVKSVNSWVMHAQVASQYSNCNATPRSPAYGNVFLVGDAAHRFPPSGGFGMNTGLQDAHNLAWKLAMVWQRGAVPSLLKSYEDERKPVAEAITALSKYNYGLTAGLARVLGVDPDLASAAVTASNSGVSKTLVPFAVRRTAVRKALETGMYSLKWLKDWQANVLGGVRVRALQHKIDTGKSLPLIFPEEDLGTVYREGALVKPDTSGNSPRHAKNAPYTGVKLQVGGRLPHCWLAPIGHVKGNSNSAAAPGPALDLAFSTVDLPVLMERLMQMQYGPSAEVSPTPVLIVHAKHEAAAVEAVRERNLCHVVSMPVVSVQTVECALASGSLQAKYQNPRYHQVPSAGPEVREESTSFARRFAPVFEGSTNIGFPATNSDGGLSVQVLRVDDVEGRWREVCQPVSAAWQREGRCLGAGRVVVPEDVAVLLRPDGHVAHVMDAKTLGLNSLYEACTALHMYRADGLNF